MRKTYIIENEKPRLMALYHLVHCMFFIYKMCEIDDQMPRIRPKKETNKQRMTQLSECGFVNALFFPCTREPLKLTNSRIVFYISFIAN